jgi:hypothetical protein
VERQIFLHPVAHFSLSHFFNPAEYPTLLSLLLLFPAQVPTPLFATHKPNTAVPFMREKLRDSMSPEFRAVKPATCPTLIKGVYAYDFGDMAGLTLLMKMHTLGHGFVPTQST